MNDPPRRFGWPKQTVQASGTASVAIAGNNLAPISTNVFMGAWFPLLQAYLDPSSLDAQIEPEHFVGREWLFKEIDEFISTNQSGYFIIEADAGLGKTAFALQLAKKGKHVSHFASIDWRAKSADSAIRNISAQLIAAWELTELAPQGMLPPGADGPSWLWQVLSTAAKRRDEKNPERPLIIVVDGLDEAQPGHTGTMPFGLPANLPAGVFVVATTRTGTSLPALRQPYKIRLLEADSAANEWDMTCYLESQVLESGLAERINETGVDPNIFSQQLLSHCSGVWIYLHCVLNEIRYGLRRLDEIDNLPSDLEGYYAQNLVDISEDKDWLSWYLPLLATLGVTVEPLDCDQIVKFAGIENADRIRQFMLTKLRPFCDVMSSTDGEERFAFYHRSLIDFLSGNFAGSSLTGHQRLRGELRRATRDAHERICQYFFAAWGDILEYFPTLKSDLSLAELEKGYGVRHLTSHLSAVGRADDVAEFVSARLQPGNSWYEAHDYIGDWEGYLRDVQVAARTVEGKTDTAYRDGVSASSLGTEFRYALVSSSINSQIARIPLPLLEALVSTGTWSVSRSLGHIRRIGDRAARSAAYICVLPYLSGPQRFLAWREALAASVRIDDADVRAKTLLSLTPFVPASQKSDVLKMAYETGALNRWQFCVETLVAFAGSISSSIVDAAFNVASKVPDVHGLTRCLVALSPRLNESLMPEVLATIELLPGDELRAELLLALAAEGAMNGFAEQALDLVRDFRNSSARAKVLAAVAGLLTEESAVDAISDALRAARDVDDELERAVTLAYIAARVTDSDLRNDVVRQALSVVERVSDPAARIEALATICRQTGGSECALLLLASADALQASDHTEFVVSGAAALAPFLPHKRAATILRHALTMVNPIQDKYQGERALAAIAGEWPAHALSRAVSLSSRIDSDVSRTNFLSALVPRLRSDLLVEILTAAETMSIPGCRMRLARILAPHVPNEMIPRILGLVMTPWVLYLVRDQVEIFHRNLSHHLHDSASTLDVDFSAALVSLAPRLDKSFLKQIFHAGQAINSPLLRLETIIAMLSYFPVESHEAFSREALRVAKSVLRGARHTAETSPSRSLKLGNEYARMLVELLCRVPDYMQDECVALLTTLLAAEWPEWDFEDLVNVFNNWPTTRRQQTIGLLLEGLSKIKDTRMLTAALMALVRALDTRTLTEVAASARDCAQRIPDKSEHILLMTMLIPYLKPDTRQVATRSVLRESIGIRDESKRVAAVVSIAHLIDGAERQALLDEMLVIATTIPAPAARCRALFALVPNFTDDRKYRILDDALAAAGSVKKIDERCRSLLSLASMSNSRYLAKILDEVSAIGDDEVRSHALAELSSQLPAELIPLAVTTARAVGNEKHRIFALSSLCKRLSKYQLDELTTHVPSVEDKENRVVLISAIMAASRSFSRIAGDYRMPFRVWADGLDRSAMFELISSATWWVAKSGGEDGILEVANAIIDVTRWWP